MSSNSYHDASGVPTLIAVETDGSTLINIKADPTRHELSVSDGTSGTDAGPSNSRHDDSHVHIFMATSSTDGITPVAVYANSSGALLIDSI